MEARCSWNALVGVTFGALTVLDVAPLGEELKAKMDEE